MRLSNFDYFLRYITNICIKFEYAWRFDTITAILNK